ncbi:MAG: hypothetical protein AB7V18_08425 [Pyrinomonadaceae bacterium]
MQRFHLGVDYGTSASKLILRHFEAPGGERAYLLEPNDSFRIPSGVTFSREDIVFSSNHEDALRSLKMRCAGEVTNNLHKYFFGELKDIPFNLSSEDIVTLSIWKLISIGHLAAVKISGNTDFKMGMTLGVPMSFLDDDELGGVYLKIARVAYHIYTNHGPIGLDVIGVELAVELLNGSRSAVDKKPPIPESNRRNWIRSETEASMFWSFKSPATPVSPFFCADIGAGTTDSCAFMINDELINGQRVKDNLVFFGAHSHPVAMDAFQFTEDRDKWCQDVRDGLVRSARKAFSRIKGNLYSVNQWSDPKLIILGGGAMNSELRRALQEHPMVNFRDTNLSILDLLTPTDLVRIDGSAARKSDVVFTSVAYGLAQIGEAVPLAERPSEVQQVRQHAKATLPSHDEIYSS